MRHRFSKLLAHFHPSIAFPIIKIVGTNGKGSVAAMLAACLKADGQKAGMFTSPHLVAITERFRVDNEDISEAKLETAADKLEPELHDFVAQNGQEMLPSFFEIMILIALQVFQQAKVDIAIFEAGVGGANDATSLLPEVLAVLTTVGMDHQEQLGESLEAIAKDKAGIISEKGELLINEHISPTLQTVIAKQVQENNGALIIGQNFLQAYQFDLTGSTAVCEVDGQQIPIQCPLSGRFQQQNINLICAALLQLRKAGYLTDIQCLTGIQHTRWEGRFEYLAGNPAYLLDAAHNVPALKALISALDEVSTYDTRLLVLGISEQKDFPALLELAPQIASTIYLVDDFHKAIPTPQLAKYLDHHQLTIHHAQALSSTLQQLQEEAKDKLVVVTGSLYLLGEVKGGLSVRSSEGLNDQIYLLPSNTQTIRQSDFLPLHSDVQTFRRSDLSSLPKFGAGTGLHRMVVLCEEVLSSDWAAQVDPIHVVGTNGKGSVSVMVSGILRELGLSCGLYTSPHLFDFRERMVVNGEMISKEALYDHSASFLAKKAAYEDQNPKDTIGAFEAFTAVALQHFFTQKADAIVLEAGIGGRYDPTRIFPGSFNALTTVELEHTQLLGNTLEEIAFDKIDIAPSGAMVVVGRLPVDLLQKLSRYALSKSITLLPIDQYCGVRQVAFEASDMTVSFEVEGMRWDQVKCAITGQHQVDNLLIASLLAKKWIEKHSPAISPITFQQAVTTALGKLYWPGRFEQVYEQPPVYVDVGHTPAAIQHIIALAKTVIEGPILLITGVSKDKEVGKIVQPLAKMADVIICTSAYHKGAPSSQVYEIAREAAKPEIDVMNCPTIEDAVAKGLVYAKAHRMTILVAGGLFLAVEAVYCLRGDDPREAAFF